MMAEENCKPRWLTPDTLPNDAEQAPPRLTARETKVQTNIELVLDTENDPGDLHSQRKRKSFGPAWRPSSRKNKSKNSRNSEGGATEIKDRTQVRIEDYPTAQDTEVKKATKNNKSRSMSTCTSKESMLHHIKSLHKDNDTSSSLLAKDKSAPNTNKSTNDLQWKSALDPTTGIPYYYKRGERISTWAKPDGFDEMIATHIKTKKCDSSVPEHSFRSQFSSEDYNKLSGRWMGIAQPYETIPSARQDKMKSTDDYNRLCGRLACFQSYETDSLVPLEYKQNLKDESKPKNKSLKPKNKSLKSKGKSMKFKDDTIEKKMMKELILRSDTWDDDTVLTMFTYDSTSNASSMIGGLNDKDIDGKLRTLEVLYRKGAWCFCDMVDPCDSESEDDFTQAIVDWNGKTAD